MKNNALVFIGFASSGKSTIGKAVAEELSFQFIDLDEQIEILYRHEHAQQKTCRAIYRDRGASGFATLEATALIRLEAQENFILATGGGAPLTKVNQPILKALGPVVYLFASPETIQDRMLHKGLPASIGGSSNFAAIQEHYAQRDPIYQRLADTIIQTDNKSIPTIVREVLDHYE